MKEWIIPFKRELLSNQITALDRVFDLMVMNSRARSLKIDGAIRRFVNFLDIVEINKCWNWTSAQAGGKLERYGVFRHTLFRGDRKQWYAHRFIYTMCFGDLDDEQLVRHTCDNTLCENPDHLLSGTPLDNMSDAKERDRTYFRDKKF